MRPLPSTILLLAVAAVTAQEAPKAGWDAATRAFVDACTLARALKAPLLVFVLPDTDGPVAPERAKAQRDAEVAAGMLAARKGGQVDDVPTIATQSDLLLRQVQLLRARAMADSGRRGTEGVPALTDLQRILPLTVIAVAKAGTCGAKPGETVMLLRADGKPVRGFAIDLQDHEAFAKALGAELLAPETLAARRDTVDPDILRSFDRMCELWTTQQSGTEEFQKLHGKLGQLVPAFAPAIVGSPRESKLDFFSESFLLQPRLPFGVEEKLMVTGDPCPTCGMGFVPPHLNSVLKLLGP